MWWDYWGGVLALPNPVQPSRGWIEISFTPRTQRDTLPNSPMKPPIPSTDTQCKSSFHISAVRSDLQPGNVSHMHGSLAYVAVHTSHFHSQLAIY